VAERGHHERHDTRRRHLLADRLGDVHHPRRGLGLGLRGELQARRRCERLHKWWDGGREGGGHQKRSPFQGGIRRGGWVGAAKVQEWEGGRRRTSNPRSEQMRPSLFMRPSAGSKAEEAAAASAEKLQ